MKKYMMDEKETKKMMKKEGKEPKDVDKAKHAMKMMHMGGKM